MKSKTGLTLATIFIIIVLGTDIYGNLCNLQAGGGNCGMVMLPFSFPWILFMESIPGNLGLYLGQAINIILVYFIGTILGKLGSLFTRT
jgi:hypothetical protein